MCWSVAASCTEIVRNRRVTAHLGCPTRVRLFALAPDFAGNPKPMANRRTERLNEQLRREISDILRRDVRDPRVGAPTVTRVEVTSDLSMARVYVRLGSDQAEHDHALTGLEAATVFVRRELGNRIRLRHVPELRFAADHTLEHAGRIEQLLREIEPMLGHQDAAEAREGGENE